MGAKLRDGLARVAGIRWVRLSVVSALVLLAVVPVYLSSMRASFTTMEESALLLYPQQLLDGQWPNQDFEHVYGPGNLWVLAGVYKVAGVSAAVERTVGVLYRLLWVVAVYGVTRGAGRLVAAGSSLMAWLLLAPFALGAHVSVGALALAVAALWCSVEVERTGSQARRDLLTFAAGVAGGLAVSYRLDLAVVVLPAQLVLLRSGGVVRRPRWLVGGASVGLAPLLVHVLVVGPGVALQAMVLDPALRHGSGRRLPVPPSLAEAPDAFTRPAYTFGVDSWMPWSLPIQFSVFFWSLIALLVVLCVAVFFRWRQDPATGRVHVAVACVAVGLVPYVVQRADPGHVGLVFTVVAPLVLWAILTRQSGSGDGAEVGGRAWREGGLVAGCVLLVAVVGAPNFLGQPIWDQVRPFDARSGSTLVTGAKGRTLPLPTGMAVKVQSVVDFLEENAAAGDRLVVGPAELGRTNYNESYLYYLLPDLVPGTYHLEMNPGTANGDESHLPADLAEADWVVLSGRYDGWYELNASTKLGSDAAAQVVRTTMEPVFAEEPYTIYTPVS